jgi:DNA polymerase/3'-5' exonuclease PolX
MKTRFPIDEARTVAQSIAMRLRLACERLVIAGSIRRGKPDVGDIELLCIPKIVPTKDPRDFFGSLDVNLLDQSLESLIAGGYLAKRLNATGGTTYGPLNKLLVHVASGIPLDVFSTTPDCWATALVCRTGPAESNTAIATEARRRGWSWNVYGPGFTNLETGEVRPMHSEAEVFAFVGFPVPPWAQDNSQ